MHEVKIGDPTARKRIIRAVTDFVGDRQIGKALDIGVRNPLTEVLENQYRIRIDNTNIDLDVGRLSGKYATIFCFEVLEHLFNPLHFLMEARRVLEDDGRLFLSTPKGRPHFLWFEHHFHEFHVRELKHLFERAGFAIVRLKYYRIRPLWRAFTGFRPFLRLLVERKCIVELKKQPGWNDAG